jgi:hypothetical protein
MNLPYSPSVLDYFDFLVNGHPVKWWTLVVARPPTTVRSPGSVVVSQGNLLPSRRTMYGG